MDKIDDEVLEMAKLIQALIDRRVEERMDRARSAFQGLREAVGGFLDDEPSPPQHEDNGSPDRLVYTLPDAVAHVLRAQGKPMRSAAILREVLKMETTVPAKDGNVRTALERGARKDPPPWRKLHRGSRVFYKINESDE